MQKKIILLFIAFSLSIYNCFAQSSPAFGSTNGVADVSQTGAATYQIPIHTPPGTNGFQPSISISYNSQAGNGVLGYGWNISGLSAISRIPKTIYHNGIAEGITLTRKDNLALDGNRLIAMNNDSTEFRTEAETYSKINGGKSKESYYWFEAKTKEGGTLQYGITEDSRLRPGGKWSQPVAWYINQSKDPNGNTINYSYSSQGGQMCLDKIEYAGNTIQFQYEDRPDKSTTYIAGASVIQSKRLTKVIVKSDGLTARTYEFTYTHDGLYSHLSSVTEYGSNNVPLNPTRFIMGSRNEESIATLSQIAKGYYKQIYSADLTGNGQSDIIVTYKSKVDGDWTNWEFHTANADGKTFTKRNGGTLTSSFKGFHVADINHDGVADVYMRTTGKETYCCITCDLIPPAYIKDNDTLASKEISLEEKDHAILPPEEPNNGCCGTCSYDRQTLVAFTHQNGSLVRMESKDTYFDHVNGDAIIYAGMNFDGDGKPDFLVLNKDYSYKTARITSSHFWMPSFPAKPNNVDLLDFNGDGRTDFMVTKDDSSFIYSFNPANSSHKCNFLV